MISFIFNTKYLGEVGHSVINQNFAVGLNDISHEHLRTITEFLKIEQPQN